MRDRFVDPSSRRDYRFHHSRNVREIKIFGALVGCMLALLMLLLKT